MTSFDLPTWLRMSFPARLVALRKQRGWTQQTLADALGLHLTQVKRYESGASQPSLDALKKIALTLSVSLDELVFDASERGPDEALRLKFEAVRLFDKDERKLAEGMLESLIVQHQAKRLFAVGARQAPVAKKRPAQRASR